MTLPLRHICTEKTSLKKSLEIWRLGKTVAFLVMEQKYKMQSAEVLTELKPSKVK